MSKNCEVGDDQEESHRLKLFCAQLGGSITEGLLPMLSGDSPRWARMRLQIFIAFRTTELA
ncbi:hypothetical protein [Bradyrhizobium arachidis]|uniref:Uncharacterized protein n=1 Tax=Bradyrhizobium arachidis TaxID=858423 RepID=A0AAE7TKM7_9BRAD|nr:hypothetical protein [Bradyrhizobium arachidis]QOZ72592.1 hypothetical protein WN72_44630 [Bradyrhizobium arachidis]